MRVLAFLLACALPSAAAAQTADYARLIETRLSAYERELRELNGTVERLQRLLDGLELRVATLERAAAQQPAESSQSPVAGAGGAGVPVASADETEAGTPGVLPGGNALELYKQGRNLLLQARLERRPVFIPHIIPKRIVLPANQRQGTQLVDCRHQGRVGRTVEVQITSGQG